MKRTRLRFSCCVKLLFGILMGVLVYSNIHLMGWIRWGQLPKYKDVSVPGKRGTAHLKITDSLTERLRNSPDTGDNVEPILAGDQSNPSAADNSLAGDREHGLPNNTKTEEQPVVNILEILENIHTENTGQAIHNGELFGPVTNSTVIIAVQVHNRLTYLRYLIQSLSQATGISSTLLIFSHDVWDQEINTLVRSIDFTQTMQIFYPYSLQTHPNTFPGESPKDCPRDLKPKKSPSINCTNSEWPDIHGHYREAKFTQTKHHWWWKANHIFHNLAVTQQFTGTVVFLEEDHFVAEDFLHILSMMQYEQANSYNEVDILCLGTYLRKFNYKSNAKQPIGFKPQLNGLMHLQGLPPFARSLKSLKAEKKEFESIFHSRSLLWAPSFLNSLLSMFHKELQFWEGGPRYSKLQKAEVGQWISSKHNMGMAFTRNTWVKMKRCSNQFCEYDDYNWDWSLQHVSLNFMKEKLQVMMVKGPRVFHIGECGVHHKKSDCDSNLVMEKVKNILKTANTFLFPAKLSVGRMGLKKKVKLKKGNGGWGDKRDHELCRNMTMPG